MGEAKRRKQLDSKWGKEKQVYGLGDIGEECFKQYGKGIVGNIQGFAPIYIQKSLEQNDRVFLESYTPSSQVIVADIYPDMNFFSITVTLSFREANALRVISESKSIEELVKNIERY